MKILVLNAWSSSLKYQLFEWENKTVIAKGIVERIWERKSWIIHTKNEEKHEFEKEIKDHKEALQNVLDLLVSEKWGVLKDLHEIDAIGHRIVHGGEYFKGSVIVHEKEKEEIRKLIPLLLYIILQLLDELKHVNKFYHEFQILQVLILLFIKQWKQKIFFTLSLMNGILNMESENMVHMELVINLSLKKYLPISEMKNLIWFLVILEMELPFVQ